MLDITVLREACCAQDDQRGPLQMSCALPTDATLRELVDRIVAGRFLQYSSTLGSMRGAFGDRDVVEVFDPHQAHRRPAEFLSAADEPVAPLAAGRVLRFRFGS